MSEDNRTQWNPGFTGAIHMEFRDNKRDLEFQSEVILNTMPLRIDMILIKKKKEVALKNEIGKMFKKYNLLEFKSPKDSLNYNTFLKGIAYACLYKSYEKHVDEIPLSEITLTFIRENPPIKLLKTLKENDFPVEEVAKGIYYINRYCEFPIQIIVTKELDENQHIWINSLTNQITEELLKKLVAVTNNLTELDDRNYASSVWEIVSVENKDILRQLKGSVEMFGALAEIMKPEIDEAYDNGFDSGKLKQLFDLLKKEIITLNVAVAESGLSIEEFEAKYQEYLG